MSTLQAAHFALRGAAVVACDEQVAVGRVHVVPIFLAAAVVIIDIVFVLRCEVRVLERESGCVVGDNYIDMDTRACNGIRDEEDD